MDTTVTYKCPNCDAGLIFDAERGDFSCEFCLSRFTEEELFTTEAHKRAERAEEADAEFASEMTEYHCPSCGAEVVADKDTAAHFCYYCHNPVVMADKVSGVFRPSRIIPFKISREEAKEGFLRFAKKKWFIPKNYFSEARLDDVAGVYYPFWVTDADTDSEIRGIGKQVRTWRQGDYRYTETTTYSVHRRGKIHFEDITASAFSGEDKDMLEGILPYPTDAYTEFSMPYLQGFLAKKRNLERDDVSSYVKGRMDDYAAEVLKKTVHGYSSFNVTSRDVSVLTSHWEYSLLPIWILTYVKKGKTADKDKTFVYAMNGHTGKIYGELPVSPWKLLLLGLGVFVGAAALLGLFGWLMLM